MADLPLREEGDLLCKVHKNPRLISIHALREEGDTWQSAPGGVAAYFYPRPPRGGRPTILLDNCNDVGISIHALREEGDLGNVAHSALQKLFLSTPSARRATVITCHYTGSNTFLSTPSARRATVPKF